MRKGSLVRVKPEQLVSLSDMEMYNDNGPLWITTGENSGDNKLLWCKALATGAEHLWYTHELEKADAGR